MFVFTVYSSISQQNLARSIVYEQVRIAPGDSLWSLAEARSVDGMSTQELVQEIRTKNQLSSSMLEPGQVLELPSDGARS
nr:LysM peptidoglycan-binding domain-containing protein [Collinsella urealyticum]